MAAPFELLSARMLNEFVYCPRLFYYEFVENVFVHNADTREGAAQHQRVDSGKGALPKAKSAKQKDGSEKTDLFEESKTEPETIHSRSVFLYSDRLRVNAKLDLVEGAVNLESGRMLYQPVEYKKGRPREGDEGNELWPADKIQLGIQILLLRENGYDCLGGLVFYRETRQRVRFLLDDETEAWILAQVEAARACAAGPIPPPLDDSPKCPRCSLVGFCLPDETRLLAEMIRPQSLPESAQMDFELDFPEEPERIDEGPFQNIPEIKMPSLKPGQDVRRLIAPAEETRGKYEDTHRLLPVRSALGVAPRLSSGFYPLTKRVWCSE